MATNVYGNGANSTAGANTIVHYYNKAGVKAANEINVYGQWADKESMPLKMGKTFKISKFLHIYDRELTDGDFATKGYLTARSVADVTTGLANDAALTEGAGAVNKRSIKKITMETSFSRYGEMIDYTDEVEMFSEDSIQVKYREELGRLANRRNEDLVQLDMLGTTNVMYSGTASSMATIGVGIAADGTEDGLFQVDYDYIRKASRRLVRNRAIKNTNVVTGSTKIDTRTINKAFYTIIGPEIKFDLESLTRGSGNAEEFAYVPAYKYAGASNLAEGEVGAMHDVRFIESESALVYAGLGAFGSGWVNDEVGNDTKFATEAEADAGGTEVTSAFVAYNGGLSETDIGEEGATKFDIYPLLFPTKGSFATVGLKGHGKIKFGSQSPSKLELSNPYGTLGFFSYNFWYAGIILQEERLLKGLAAASA